MVEFVICGNQGIFPIPVADDEGECPLPPHNGPNHHDDLRQDDQRECLCHGHS